MKKLYFFFLVFLFCSDILNGQGISQLWGMTGNGGPDNQGVMFSTNSSGDNFQLRYLFNRNSRGTRPKFTKPVDYNGKFYGMTTEGGNTNEGVLFEWDPGTNIYTKKVDFNSTIGSNPSGSLTLNAGKFYGTTSSGGVNGNGVIFEWDPATNMYTKKIDMTNPNGGAHQGSLTFYNGKFYGATFQGGSNNVGVIFEWNPVTNIYTKKIDFSLTSPHNVYGNLTIYGGKFYGLSNGGGANGKGTIFEWDPISNLLIKKVDFNGINGGGCLGSLTLMGTNLYGMTYDGGINNKGVIFEWDPNTNVYVKKIDLTSSGGEQPQGDLTLYSGKFYSITRLGGLNNKGVIFEWDPNTNVYVKKIDLEDSNGSLSQGSLVPSGGKLYGLTYSGGTNGFGVIFQWDPVSNVYAKKIDFLEPDGINPLSSLTVNGGKAYGTTSTGGKENYGVLFEWDLSTKVYIKKIDFSPSTAYQTRGPNLAMIGGIYYGMTSLGGSNSAGVIYSWNPVTNIFTIRHSFSSVSGYYPENSSLTVYGGKLYGMASAGGAGNGGVVFEFDPATFTYTKKIDFNGANGSFPYHSLTPRNGKFYGMTNTGGANNKGVIFEWDPVTNVYTKKVDLTTAGGSNPQGNLTESGGKFYGITYAGGINNLGAIFEWDPITNVYTKKIDFALATGSQSFGTLTLSGGKFYGMTSNGGTNNKGVIFEWDPVSNIYNVKKHFNGADGGNAIYNNNLALLPAPASGGVANTCTAFPSVTINNTNNNVWVPIVDLLGDAIGEIKANGNNLGIVNTSMYINSGPVREDGNNRLYLDRNLSINPQVQPNSPVDIRLYLKGSEFEALKNAVNSLGQPSGINTINDVSFFKNSNVCSPTLQNSANPIPVTAAAWNNDYVLTASISSFSSFYMANKTYAVLPLKLIEFYARLFNNNSELSWKTENETGTLSFDIERSLNGSTFKSIGNIPAISQPGTHSYNYTDKNISLLDVRVIYYRLRQQDNDGKFIYSQIISLPTGKGQPGIVIYPNPVINDINFTVSINQHENVKARIIDNTGRVVKKQQWYLSVGNNNLNVDVSRLERGIYTLELKGKTTNDRKNFVKH